MRFWNFFTYLVKICFLIERKLVNITLIFRKCGSTSEIIKDQLFFYILSTFQCDFRIGYGEQYCFLMQLETWNNIINNKKTYSELLTDLSKAFDCLCDDLLIAKLRTRGLEIALLNMLQNYLTDRLFLSYTGKGSIRSTKNLYPRATFIEYFHVQRVLDIKGFILHWLHQL